jgi:hypothetical protein
MVELNHYVVIKKPIDGFKRLGCGCNLIPADAQSRIEIVERANCRF